jgi:hypothetical protein
MWARTSGAAVDAGVQAELRDSGLTMELKADSETRGQRRSSGSAVKLGAGGRSCWPVAELEAQIDSGGRGRGW